MSSLIGSLFGGGEGGFGDFNPFDHSSAERHYQDVYYAPPERHHEAKFSHEAISAAAGFAAMHAYEAHLRATGQEVSHPVMKEILAAIAAAEVDKLAETKGLDWLDRHKAKKMAEKQAHALAEQRYGRGGNGWEYARSQGGPSYEYNFGGGNPYYASGYGGGNVGGYAGGGGSGYGGSQYGGGYGGGGGGYGAPPQAAYGGEYGAPPGPPPGAYGGYGGPPQGEYGGYGAQGGYGGYGGPPQGAYGAPPPPQGAYGYGEPPFEERREHHHGHHHHREEY